MTYRVDCPHIAMLQVKLGANFEALTASEKYTLIAVFALYSKSGLSRDLAYLANFHEVSLTENARWVVEALDDSEEVDREDLLDFILDFTMHIIEGIHA